MEENDKGLEKLMKRCIIVLCSAFLLIGCSDQKYQVITQEKAHRYLEERQDIVLLDVRTSTEYRGKHIPNAINVSSVELKDKIESVIPDKNTTIYVYCQTGSRSEISSKELIEMGYTKVYDMGGIDNWIYETVK